jgi:hypothetical protein
MSVWPQPQWSIGCLNSFIFGYQEANCGVYTQVHGAMLNKDSKNIQMKENINNLYKKNSDNLQKGCATGYHYDQCNLTCVADQSQVTSLINQNNQQTNTNNQNQSNSNIVLDKTLSVSKIDSILSKRLSGQILLQVEKNGEAWYVNPKDNKRYYMANGNEAYRIMQYLGIGITNKNLEKIKNNKVIAKKSSGKIFLQIESKGEAYYIDFNGNVHYLKNGTTAYEVMKNLGLGITNNDLNKIAEGKL